MTRRCCVQRPTKLHDMVQMLKISARYTHFVFSVIQSGLTCAVAAAIASMDFLYTGGFGGHWIKAWLLSWATMLPVVLVAAPVIRRIAEGMTR